MRTFTCDLAKWHLRDPVNNDTAWAYNNAGRATMETNDAAGNLRSKKDRNERVTQFTFDDLDRLTADDSRPPF